MDTISEDKIKELEARGEIIYFNKGHNLNNPALNYQDVKEIILHEGANRNMKYSYALVAGHLYEVSLEGNIHSLKKLENNFCRQNTLDSLIETLRGK